MSSNISNDMVNVSLNESEAVQMNDASHQLSLLEEAKLMVYEQEEHLKETRNAVREAGKKDEAVEGQSREVAREAARGKRMRLALALDDYEEALMTLNRLKRSFLIIYPNEPVFGAVPSSPPTSRAQKPLPPRLVKELPGLKFKHDAEPIMIRKDLIHTDVTAFVAHFEHVFAVHGIDIDTHHQKPLSWCLSESLLNHYELQQAAVEDGQSQTWTMAKDWLASFVETPAILIGNVQALFNLRLQSNETSSAYFARVREARKKVRIEKLTVDQVVAIAIMISTPVEWQRSFQREMEVAMKEGKSSESEVMDLLTKLECETVTVKRQAEGTTSPFKKSRVKVSNKIPFKACNNRWVNPANGKEHTCKQGYVSRHNKVCPVLKAKRTSANSTPRHDHVTAAPKYDLCRSKYGPRTNIYNAIVDALLADKPDCVISSDDSYDRLCKFSKTSFEERPILNSTFPSS